MRETVEISGDVSEANEAYLDEKFGDDVLDFQIYYNDGGEHSVAVAAVDRSQDLRDVPRPTVSSPSSNYSRTAQPLLPALQSFGASDCEMIT